jgi:acyl dehydratase
MKFLEDFEVGERTDLGAHTFTAEDIKRFASAFDPQPFHMDEEAAKASHFGRLCASGWHTVAVWMRLNVRHAQRLTRERQAEGLGIARVGPSPGFEELKWLKPVYAGDRISFGTEVLSKRASRSRPGWGLLTMRSNARNQAGQEVMSFIANVFIESRAPRPAKEDAPR